MCANLAHVFSGCQAISDLSEVKKKFFFWRILNFFTWDVGGPSKILA